MSVALARYLEQQGYDTSVIGDDIDGHAWVYVWTGKNRAWAIEATANELTIKKGAGEVIGDEWWDVFSIHGSIGRALNDLTNSNNAFELYCPTKARKGVVVLEWYQVGPSR